MTERPILIGGCGRSGTTLLLSLMSVHPEIFTIPEETCSFCRSHYPDGPDPPAEFNINGIYWRLLESDIPSSCHRWVEKTPKNVQVIDRLIGYFGKGLRFLNIVRDGRDVVTSTHPSDEENYWVSPERWVEDVSAGKRLECHDQVLTVRYEDLTSDYISTMRTVMNFVGESFPEVKFVDYPKTSSLQTSQAWSGSAQNVHTRSVRRWKQPDHVEVVNRLLDMPQAQELLRHYNYL